MSDTIWCDCCQNEQVERPGELCDTCADGVVDALDWVLGKMADEFGVGEEYDKALESAGEGDVDSGPSEKGE